MTAVSVPRVIVVTASDSKFMPFLRGMLTSIAAKLAESAVDLACFDIGLEADDVRWLEDHGACVVAPGAHLGVDAATIRPALLSFLARPFLPAYFPGYDVYFWIDSDVWLQDLSVFDTYITGAVSYGMAITHEREPSYRFQPWLLGWTTKHFLLGYGVVHTAYQLTRRHVNAGMFAIRADAPHWQAWAQRYEAAIAKTGALVPHDQFALNQAVHDKGRTRLPVLLLPPRNNWICDRGIPMWNDTAEAFCEPRAPYAPLGALHLAGPAKRTAYVIRRTRGGQFTTCLCFGAGPQSPALCPLGPG